MAITTTISDKVERSVTMNSAKRLLTVLGKTNNPIEIDAAFDAITPTVGTEMFDADARVFTTGTYSWFAAGGNTIENIDNSLKVTYVNNSAGASMYFKDASDLNANLTVGAWYQYGFDIKVGTEGNFVGHQVGETTVFPAAGTSSLEFVTVTTRFRASHATDNFAQFNGMSAGETVFLDNLTMKPVTATDLFLVDRKGKTGTYQCKPTVADNSAVGLKICYKDANNFLWFVLRRYNNTTYKAQLFKVVAGVWTSVISADAAYAAERVLKLIVDGTNCTLYYNGSLIGTTTAVSEITTLGTNIYAFNNLDGNTVGVVTTTRSTNP